VRLLAESAGHDHQRDAGMIQLVVEFLRRIKKPKSIQNQTTPNFVKAKQERGERGAIMKNNVSYIIGLSDATNKKREEKKLLQERRIDV
jgi:hypothetical protein